MIDLENVWQALREERSNTKLSNFSVDLLQMITMVKEIERRRTHKVVLLALEYGDLTGATREERALAEEIKVLVKKHNITTNNLRMLI